jgi:hypothetical protein
MPSGHHRRRIAGTAESRDSSGMRYMACPLRRKHKGRRAFRLRYVTQKPCSFEGVVDIALAVTHVIGRHRLDTPVSHERPTERSSPHWLCYTCPEVKSLNGDDGASSRRRADQGRRATD